MNGLLISKYIDNELNLDEKIELVKSVKKDDEFYEETLSFLEEEKILSFKLYYSKPIKTTPPSKLKLVYSSGMFKKGLMATVFALFFLSVTFSIFKFYPALNQQKTSYTNKTLLYRFVYYNPKVKRVAIIGSFTEWKKIYLKKLNTGYWQITLKMPKKGLHKYNFVINNKFIDDPSNPARIYNGFGGFDSVINIS